MSLSVYVLTDVRKELSGGYSQETLKKKKKDFFLEG